MRDSGDQVQGPPRRRRLRWPRSLRAAGRRIVTLIHPPRYEQCLVCDAPTARATTLRRKATQPADRTVCRFLICTSCGHVGNPENKHDYRKFTSPDALPLRARVGTSERPGREFHMARMAIDILGRSDLDVLIFGAGRSRDNEHVERQPEVPSVAITDIMRIREDATFIDADDPDQPPFDIVIASEVVEHFFDPVPDVARLVRLVAPGGLLVCSTNVFEGRGLARHRYPFIPGHTSYYTGRSLGVIADRFGFSLDLRIPLVATGYAGKRKRYVLMTTSDDVRASIAHYFEGREYAPSEDPWPDGVQRGVTQAD